MYLKNNNPRFIDILDEVESTIYKQNYISVPVDIIEIIKCDQNIVLLTYSELKQYLNIDNKTLRTVSGSKDAFIAKKGKKYIIGYNDEMNEGRIRFSLAHEYAHYVLGHLNNMSNIEYQEKAANKFASLLLIPISVLHICMMKQLNVEDIASLFNVSNQAATIACEVLERQLPYLSDNQLYRNAHLFQSIIHQLQDIDYEPIFFDLLRKVEITFTQLELK